MQNKKDGFMTIYILDNDPAKSAQYLDDKSLDKCIKDVAQVLCKFHRHFTVAGVRVYEACPLYVDKLPKDLLTWFKWGQECVANYLWLVKYGLECCYEYDGRFNEPNDEDLLPKNQHKYTDIIVWARDNVPDLPTEFEENGTKFSRQSWFHTPFPLVMPKKYISEVVYAKVWGDGDNFEHLRVNLDKIVLSYRNYYQAKLRQKPSCFHKWTNRQIPEWLNL